MYVTETFTFGEFEALALLYGKYSHVSPHQAGNEIIALAERIRAERAVVAMQRERDNRRAGQQEAGETRP